MIYAGVTILIGFTFPRFEYRYLADYKHGMTVVAATAIFSSVASGMLALTGIIFSLAFVMVQFSSLAYSPRLVLWFSRDPVISHGMGVFTATFLFSLSALAWVDRNGDGKVPFFSTWLVFLLVIASVLILALLVQRLAVLQVSGVIAFVGKKGRQVTNEWYPTLVSAKAERPASVNLPIAPTPNLPVTQTLIHTGAPMVITEYDVHGLVQLAGAADGVITLPYPVGDSVFEGDTLAVLHGAANPIPLTALGQAVQLERQRAFEQDPKYAIRLLVDISIKALSPAVNDPTTAVQALDEIEDLLLRLGKRQLDIGKVKDGVGVLRLIFPTPTWEDFLSLAFDEIRFYGNTSLQVMRRLRTALCDLVAAVPLERQQAVRHYLEHLDQNVKGAIADAEDRSTAMHQDRQGLGLTRED